MALHEMPEDIDTQDAVPAKKGPDAKKLPKFDSDADLKRAMEGINAMK